MLSQFVRTEINYSAWLIFLFFDFSANHCSSLQPRFSADTLPAYDGTVPAAPVRLLREAATRTSLVHVGDVLHVRQARTTDLQRARQPSNAVGRWASGAVSATDSNPKRWCALHLLLLYAILLCIVHDDHDE